MLTDRCLNRLHGGPDRSSEFQSNGHWKGCPIDYFNRFHKTGEHGSKDRYRKTSEGKTKAARGIAAARGQKKAIDRTGVIPGMFYFGPKKATTPRAKVS